MRLLGRMPRPGLGTIDWILLLGFLGYHITPQVKAGLGAGAGDSIAPTVELRTLTGVPVSLEQYRGEVVLHDSASPNAERGGEG